MRPAAWRAANVPPWSPISPGCDACVETVAVVHSRLGLAPTVETPVPLGRAATRRRGACRADERGGAERRARPSAGGRERAGVVGAGARLAARPVLIPAAVAAGALLMVSVMHQPNARDGERSRALAPAAVHLRVTATEARVYARPSQNSALVGSVHAARCWRLPEKSAIGTRFTWRGDGPVGLLGRPLSNRW